MPTHATLNTCIALLKYYERIIVIIPTFGAEQLYVIPCVLHYGLRLRRSIPSVTTYDTTTLTTIAPSTINAAMLPFFQSFLHKTQSNQFDPRGGSVHSTPATALSIALPCVLILYHPCIYGLGVGWGVRKLDFMISLLIDLSCRFGLSMPLCRLLVEHQQYSQ